MRKQIIFLFLIFIFGCSGPSEDVSDSVSVATPLDVEFDGVLDETNELNDTELDGLDEDLALIETL